MCEGADLAGLFSTVPPGTAAKRPTGNAHHSLTSYLRAYGPPGDRATGEGRGKAAARGRRGRARGF